MSSVDAQAEGLVQNQFPCSASQERCWFLDQMSPGTPALNVAVRWAIKGRFTASAFQSAFRDVIARHEILRTSFVAVNGQPVQQVADQVSFHLPEIDIRNTPKADQHDRIEAIAEENASLPFDLTEPGLIRASLVRLSENEAILVIAVHQSCFDGWSIGVLGREVGAYAAMHMGISTANLDPLPLQYGDYALWQRAYFDSDAFVEDIEPVRDRIADAPYFELPPDKPRPPFRTASCDMVMTDLPVSFGTRLNIAAKAQSMSPFALGAGVLSAALARSTDVDEVTMGTQVAGRTEVDLEPLIGVFINNVVMRFKTPQGISLSDHLDNARQVVQSALIGQNVPFNKLVEVTNPTRDPSRTPLISVNFILQNAFLETATYGDFELSSAPSHAPGTIYDLNFILIGRPSGWRMTLEYSSDLFNKSTANELLNIWQAAFEFAFDSPHKPMAEIPHLAARDVSNAVHTVAKADASIEQSLSTSDDLELRLASVWQDLLGLQQVKPTDNFFDLGGHSLLTVRMLTRIDEKFGRRLSLADVYHAPTLRALARHLQTEAGLDAAIPEAEQQPSDWRVLPLQTEGEGTPIIAINNAQTVFALSNALDTTRPATAVRIFDASRNEPLPERDFDQIAAEYADAVRSAQPNGPYVLFGVCVHGNLAIEVARQLQNQGETVAAVIMKDVWEPAYAARINANPWASLIDKIHHKRVRFRFFRRGEISFTAFLGTIGPIRRSGLLEFAVKMGVLDRVRHTDLDAEQEGFITYLSEARNKHRPAPYTGTVLHFVTNEAPKGRSFDPSMGWDDLISDGLKTVRLPELSIANGKNIGVNEAAEKIEALIDAYERSQVNA